jgi:hypothetical protein
MGVIVTQVRRNQAIRNLRRLHRTLAATPLASRCWIHGGVLLGWARHGDFLNNDLHDVDLGYYVEDDPLFEAAVVPALEQAGFRLKHVYRNTAGQVAMRRYRRATIDYEFFVMWPSGNARRCFSYGLEPGTEDYFENVHEYPDTGLETFNFAGCAWMKPADHDAYLAANYGDWRTDNPSWSYWYSPSIVERHYVPDRPSVI